ncbi:MAG: DegT/DnrJ/EryC1/StrS family aminotransferase [Alphaproteobacteria bacterium]|nr:DegT/DnrJ/EryC1/StrS family aminotransferase [Alphaproteobacteria bacterium]
MNRTPPKLIPVAGPSITAREVEYVRDAAQNAWGENVNLYHARFEAAFAQAVGRKYAMALPSATAGLHLALAGLGVGAGDEVIVPDVTWIATAAPVSYVGATPVFADMDAVSWCVTAESIAACITPRTRAIIIVDLYGAIPPMDELLALAARHKIPVIEDAAEAAGSTYRGRRAGGFGHASVFSFHGSKTLTTGEGGMLLTDDGAFFARCQFLRDHGRAPGDVSFRSSEVAFKYKMSAMQAAMGLAQIERLPELFLRKREIFGWYRELLADVRGVTLNGEAEGVRNSYWMVTAILPPQFRMDKPALMAAFREHGVATRPMFDPLSDIPAFSSTPQAALARARNHVSYAIAPRGINLPSGFNLTHEDVARVCTALKEILLRNG